MYERHNQPDTKRSLPFSTNRESYESSQMVYDMRKQVLDKLDLILQKVNLSVLKCLDSGTKNIKLISMTDLEQEIQDLFLKLNECIANRQKFFQMYDHDVISENHYLQQENDNLRRENAELLQKLNQEDEDRASPLSKISALQREVENLNNQIIKYGDWKDSNSLAQEKYISHNKLLINLHKILKQSGRLRLLALGIKKVFKQYSQSFLMMRNDVKEKLEGISEAYNNQMKSVLKENLVLKDEIDGWENEMEGIISRIRHKE